MSLRPEERRQIQALSGYLKTLPDRILNAVLFDLGATPAPEKATAKPRVCRTCGKPYPVCRSLWADDHEFEAVPHRAPQQREGD